MIEEDKEILDETIWGIDIEIEQIFNKNDIEEYSSMKKMICFPSNNILIFISDNHLYIYDTQTFEKIKKYKSDMIFQYSELVKFNEEYFLTVERCSDLKNWIRRNSVSDILHGNNEDSISNRIGTGSLQDKKLYRLNKNCFLSVICQIPNFYFSMNEHNCIEIFNFYDKKLLKTFFFSDLNISFTKKSALIPSRKFKNSIYVCHKKRCEDYVEELQQFVPEQVELINLDSEASVEKYINILEKSDTEIKTFSITKNQNGDELVIFSGKYLCNDDCEVFSVVNFSKSPPEIEKRVYGNTKEYKNLHFLTFYYSHVLNDQILFLGDRDCGYLLIVDVRNNFKKLVNKSILKEKTKVKNIHMLSYSSDSLKILVTGSDNAKVVNLKGVKLDFSGENKFLEEDEKERRKFILEHQDRYVFSSEIRKKCFLDLKLYNFGIKNILKVLL